jgi:hypothetical protein
MKRTTLIVLLCLLTSLSFAQQKKTIYISTKLPIKYRIFLNEELQLYGDASSAKIANVPFGEKKLSLTILTPSNQKPSLMVAKTNEKEEYYVVEQIGETYVLKSNPNGAKENKTYYSKASFIPKPKPAPKDSNAPVLHTCKISDSILNRFIVDMSSLKDAKVKKEFTLNFMKRKCLYTHQIKSIGYRIDDDMIRFDLYKILSQQCLDRNSYLDLVNSFQSQKYGNLFIAWYEDLKK